MQMFSTLPGMRATATIPSRMASSGGRCPVHPGCAQKRTCAGSGASHAGSQLLRHLAGERRTRSAKTIIPRHDRLQQRPLLHQGQRRERCEYGLLRRYNRRRLPERYWSSGSRRAAAYRSALLRSGDSADHGPAEQHVHPRGFPNPAREVCDRCQQSLRALVCRRKHLICCG